MTFNGYPEAYGNNQGFQLEIRQRIPQLQPWSIEGTWTNTNTNELILGEWQQYESEFDVTGATQMKFRIKSIGNNSLKRVFVDNLKVMCISS